MQTFLPYPNFQQSARCLDNRRLGKQRVEAWQIYLALTKPNYGWKNHPAVKMWKGHEDRLLAYGLLVCQEWIDRGFKDTLQDKMLDEFKRLMWTEDPAWLGQESFHASHRSNLLRKDPKHYGRFDWKESNDLPYIWPQIN